MPQDDPDFVERAEAITEKLYGAPLSAQRMVDNFALYSLEKRAAALQNVENELRGDLDSSPHSLRRRVQLMELHRKMGVVHKTLRKAGR